MDEAPFGVYPDRYLPLPDFRLPFTAYYANDLTHEGQAQSDTNGSSSNGSSSNGSSSNGSGYGTE
ncbi:MAG TPA: hypothetical protein VFG00_00810, partial [Acidothermaceae bacterium]|nr:hypothetical protein [Acidothermaceae bacterium]